MRKSKRRFWIAVALAGATCVISAGCLPSSIDYATPKALLDPYKGAVAQIIALLDQQKGDDAKALLAELEGAVSGANAALTGVYFTGSANVLTDPFTLSAGTYRVHLKTNGAPFVDIVPLATPNDTHRLFALITNDAVNGMSTLYVSTGDRIMLQFTFVDAPYELWFEKIT